MLKKIKGFFPVKFKTYIKKFKKYNAYNQLDKKLLKYVINTYWHYDVFGEHHYSGFDVVGHLIELKK